ARPAPRAAHPPEPDRGGRPDGRRAGLPPRGPRRRAAGVAVPPRRAARPPPGVAARRVEPLDDAAVVAGVPRFEPASLHLLGAHEALVGVLAEGPDEAVPHAAGTLRVGDQQRPVPEPRPDLGDPPPPPAGGGADRPDPRPGAG